MSNNCRTCKCLTCENNDSKCQSCKYKKLKEILIYEFYVGEGYIYLYDKEKTQNLRFKYRCEDCDYFDASDCDIDRIDYNQMPGYRCTCPYPIPYCPYVTKDKVSCDYLTMGRKKILVRTLDDKYDNINYKRRILK